MGKKKKQKSGKFASVLIYIGVLFTLFLGILKMIGDKGSWLGVFIPVIVAFLIVFILNALKLGIKKL